MVIFLDVDGVLNREADWKYNFTINKQCMRNFLKLYHKTHAKIILISTWKYGFVKSGSVKNAQYIKTLEESMCIDGVLPDGDRLEQVRIYVRENSITDYIILDDDTGEYPEMDDHIYIVDSQTGFTRNDIRNCRRKLRR